MYSSFEDVMVWLVHGAAQSTSKVLLDFLAGSSPIRFAGFPTLPRLPGRLPQASATVDSR